MLNDLWKKRENVVSRSISAENFTGEKGKGGMATEGYSQHAARELGQGWKVAPFLNIPAHSETTLAEIRGAGIIKHIWFVPLNPELLRDLIIRIYWEESEEPAVEVPLGDFFVSCTKTFWQISSLAVCRNPFSGYNCYWEMPFRRHCRITLENLTGKDEGFGYQVDYELCEVPENLLYFHTQFRRTNPLPYKENYTILDGIEGKGCYTGVSMLYGLSNDGWWGEGEIKFFLDGDGEFPTICGTGTEDYFCGSYDFDINGKYGSFSSPYSGFFPWPTDDTYRTTKRYSMYRWHLNDPIYFDEDIRVEIQALGWRSEGRYLPLMCDISSAAFFYLDKPAAARPPMPDRDALEIV